MKETFRYLLSVAAIVALTVEEKESFDKCAMQKGQHCQQHLEVSLGSASFGIEPRELCSDFAKMISCLRAICGGSTDSFVQNIKKKHDIKCVSSGVDLKCDIDSCWISYLMTIMDHPDQRCCAADVFKACVHEACKESTDKGLINVDKLAMELFEITSCTKDTYNYSCIVDLKCDIDLCGTSYLKNTTDHPEQRCRAADAFTVCVHEACKDSPYKDFINITKGAMEIFGINSCTKDKYYIISHGVDFKCDIESCGMTYLKTINYHPDRRCCAADVFKACVHKTCKESTDKGLMNVDKLAMELFGITSCTKDKYNYSCIVDLKCDIDLCGTSYLKNTTDHPEERCRAADAFTVCVHEACKDSPYKGIINITKRAMELFGINSCTKDKYYYSCLVDRKCDIDTCGSRYLKTTNDHPEDRCRAADAFTDCVHEACKDVFNIAKIAMYLFGITSCPEDTYDYLKACIMDLHCDIKTCGTIYLKTVMDHTDTRCGAADAFTACVHEACKDSPNMSLINFAKRSMVLFGITSCT